MIGSSKNKGEIIRENAFEHKKKKPGLSANQPSNNRAQPLVALIRGTSRKGPQPLQSAPGRHFWGVYVLNDVSGPQRK